MELSGPTSVVCALQTRQLYRPDNSTNSCNDTQAHTSCDCDFLSVFHVQSPNKEPRKGRKEEIHRHTPSLTRTIISSSSPSLIQSELKVRLTTKQNGEWRHLDDTHALHTRIEDGLRRETLDPEDDSSHDVDEKQAQTGNPQGKPSPVCHSTMQFWR